MKPAIYEDDEGNEYEDYSAFVEHDVDEAKMEKLGIKRRLEAVSIPRAIALGFCSLELVAASFRTICKSVLHCPFMW